MQTANVMERAQKAIFMVCATMIMSCGEPPPPAPSAVITASPTSLCIDDGFATPIHLDALSSAQSLTLVYVRPDPNAPPLSFLWSFEGSAMQFDDGDPKSDVLTVRMRGDRPLHVKLRVQNAAGGVTETLTTISVTARDKSGNCPLPPP